MAEETEARQILDEAIAKHGPDVVAEELNTDRRTVARWQKGRISRPGLVYHACTNILNNRIGIVPDSEDSQFSFIDLFAGIGGTRIGFERAGGKCVYTSEWDRFSTKTYSANFGDEHAIVGDITQIDPTDIPDHDVLVAGFPCQPFSIAGVSKKNALGRAHGFECETQGTLFFYIEKIIESKRPAAFLLENVKNLQNHDKGRTFEVIRRTLEEKLDYKIKFDVIDGKAFTPQHRERIYIVGFRNDVAFDWEQVDLSNDALVVGRTMRDILHPEDGSEKIEKDFIVGSKGKVNPKYTLSPKLWEYLQDYAAKHKAKGNGFGFGLVKPDDTCRTLSARYYKDGSEILIWRGPRARPRRLTPRECARLMGFPENFQIPVSDTQAYKQFGNSVVIPVVESIAKAMLPHIISIKQTPENQLALVV